MSAALGEQHERGHFCFGEVAGGSSRRDETVFVNWNREKELLLLCGRFIDYQANE